MAVSVALYYLCTRPTTTTRERRVRKQESGNKGPEQQSGDKADDNEDKASQHKTVKDGTKKSGGAKKVWTASRQEWKKPEANPNQEAEHIELVVDMDTLVYKTSPGSSSQHFAFSEARCHVHTIFQTPKLQCDAPHASGGISCDEAGGGEASEGGGGEEKGKTGAGGIS